MVRTIHSENMKALAEKLREEIDFNRFVCFDPVTFDLLTFDPKKRTGIILGVPSTYHVSLVRILQLQQG